MKVNPADGAARVLRLFKLVGERIAKIAAGLEDCPTCSAKAWVYIGIVRARMEFYCQGCGLKLTTLRSLRRQQLLIT